MLRNYFAVARRVLFRNPVYSGINIVGLAVGMTAALLIVVFVLDEFAYDRHHEHSDRIVRLTRETSALSAAPMGPALADNMSGVEAMTRVLVEDGVDFQTAGDDTFEERLLLSDASFLRIFTHEFLAGDPESALDRPDGLVISSSLARRLFGSEEALGRTVTASAGSDTYVWEITGVFEDIPRTSHFTYHAVGSFEIVARASGRMENWTTNWLYTYLLLSDGRRVHELNNRLESFLESRAEADLAPFRLMPLTDIHLRSDVGYEIEPQGSLALVRGLSAAAMLILLIACANFTNMAIARASRRAKEIGMRKALGAHRRQLIAQFMGEAVLLVIVAGALAVVLSIVALPLFNQISGKTFTTADLMAVSAVASLAGILLVTGVAGGGYPSWVLSRQMPVESLRGRMAREGRPRLLRHGLVVGQFAISMFLIVVTLFIDRQVRFMQSADPGFEKQARLVVPFDEDVLEEREDFVRQLIESVPGVEGISLTDNVPGEEMSDFLYRPDAWPRPDDLPGWDTYFVDDEFIPVLGMDIIRGRNFNEDIAGDRSAFVINEEAAEILAAEGGEAWSDPVGRQLEFLTPGAEGWTTDMTGPVIGVVRNFHNRSFHNDIQPLVIQFQTGAWASRDAAIISISNENVPNTLDGIASAYGKLGSNSPFESFFLDRHLNALYEEEARTARLVSYFSLLAVIIACLGLFAVSAYAAEGRRREIGIRKVFGAGSAGIAMRFVREYAVLVIAAAVLAIPAAWILVDRWLQSFAYRVDPNPAVFAAGIGLTLVFAVMTVLYHALRTAGTDPATVLRQP